MAVSTQFLLHIFQPVHNTVSSVGARDCCNCCHVLGCQIVQVWGEGLGQQTASPPQLVGSICRRSGSFRSGRNLPSGVGPLHAGMPVHT